MIRSSLILGVLVIFVLILSFGCSTTEDKFVGKWYDEKGELNCEITKDGEFYTWQTFHKGTKMAVYKRLFISEEGYLLSDQDDEYKGFKIIDENKIISVNIFKADEIVDEGYELTRGTEND